MDELIYRILTAITDLGDSAVLTTLVIAVSLVLFLQHCRREALIFAGSYVATSIVISITKILLMGCGSQLRAMGLHSPSGHSALSITVLGSLGLLFRNRVEGPHRDLPFLLLLALAVMIALTRILLGFHTKEEVAAGMLIGIVMLFFTSRLLTRQKAGRMNPLVLVYISLAVAFLTHGLRLPAENIIQLFASHFRALTHCA